VVDGPLFRRPIKYDIGPIKYIENKILLLEVG